MSPKSSPIQNGADLLNAPQMAIYDQIIIAGMQGYGPEFSAALRKLCALPVQERYIWRVISGLGFAFGDFDSACVRLDLTPYHGLRLIA